MKKLVLIYFLSVATIFLISNLEIISGTKTQSPGHCSVYSVVGGVLRGLGIDVGYCEVTCPPPSTPHCKSGFFGVDCHCDPGGHHGIRSIPDWINQQALDIATNFIAFCENYGTTNMSNLAGICRNVLLAVQNNDTNSYSYWEDQFDTQYDNLLAEEVTAIDNWIANYH